MSAKTLKLFVTGHDMVIHRVGHAITPQKSMERLVAEVPMHIEDGPRTQCGGSMAAMGPVSLISETACSSNQTQIFYNSNANTSQLF